MAKRKSSVNRIRQTSPIGKAKAKKVATPAVVDPAAVYTPPTADAIRASFPDYAGRVDAAVKVAADICRIVYSMTEAGKIKHARPVYLSVVGQAYAAAKRTHPKATHMALIRMAYECVGRLLADLPQAIAEAVKAAGEAKALHTPALANPFTAADAKRAIAAADKAVNNLKAVKAAHDAGTIAATLDALALLATFPPHTMLPTMDRSIDTLILAAIGKGESAKDRITDLGIVADAHGWIG